jgi:hypothetical protein
MDLKDSILSSPEGSCLNGNKHLLDNIDFIAERIKNISGDIVECGVWKGATFSYMANVFPERTMWAYDSFEGIPADKHQTKYTEKYNNMWSTCCPDLVADVSFLYDSFSKYNVQDINRINIVKGWFKDTLPNAKHPIALLRVDGDLYSSTYEILEYLYPLVVDGGFVIFDDYCIEEARQAVHDYFFNTQKLPKFYDVSDKVPWHKEDIFITESEHNMDSIRVRQGVFVQK